MLEVERKWLAALPWQAVVAQNQELCLKDQQPHGPKANGFEEARRLWEASETKVLRLREALDLFRRVHKIAPFQFFNGNTMAAVARTMIGEVLDQMPSVQSEMARRTVAHYAVGAIKAGELEAVLSHVEEVWRQRPLARPSQTGPASTIVP